MIRKTKRGRSILYYCKSCKRHFSVKTVYPPARRMMIDHLEGLSYSEIASKQGMSKTKAYGIIIDELRELPDNNQFTFNYCSRFSNVFQLDGKYISVKGYGKKIPLLWGVDYFRHDFPIFTLARSENYQAWARYFSYFRIINHYPQLVVCDDNSNIKIAARFAFPRVKIQTCYNHFKENVRRDLKVRSNDTYKKFSKEIDLILSQKRSEQDFNSQLLRVFNYYKHDPVALKIIMQLERNKDEFLAFQTVKGAPVTTNMIEGFNKHLEDRIRALHGFSSFYHAKLWLNGYILKRRFTKFQNCRGKFRKLNGHTPLQQTKNLSMNLPSFF